MSVRELMSQLQGLDVKIWVEGDRLQVSAPEGALSPALKDEMRWRKPEILSFLGMAARTASIPASIVPLQTEGSSIPVFAVPGHNGDVFCYVRFASELGRNRPFYALQPPGLDGRREPVATIEELAGVFAADVAAFYPHGPLILAGYCVGGMIAFETASQLLSAGRDVAMLALFGSPCPTAWKPMHQAAARVKLVASRLGHHTRKVLTLPPGERLGYLRERARTAARPDAAPADDVTVRRRVTLENTTIAAVKAYDPGIYARRITLYAPDTSWLSCEDRPRDWKKFAAEGVDERVGPEGCQADYMLRQYAPDFARLFAADLGRLRSAE